MPSRLHRLLFLAATVAACGDDTSSGTPPIDGAASCPTGAPWASAPPVLLGPTQETAAVALDAKIHVVGGFNSSLGILRGVQIYDTATCTWSMGPDLPRAIHHANVAAVDGTIYVVGGLEGGGFVAIGDVWAWTPGRGEQWTALAAMPPGTERGSAVVGVIDGVIIVAGGFRSGAVSDVSSFDPRTGAWDTALPRLPQPRDHACGGVVAGALYVVGGRNGTVESIAADVYEYAPGGAWRARSPMPTARGGTACGVIDDRIVIVGGEGNRAAPAGVFAEVEAYIAASDAWDRLAAMPTPRHGMGAAAWEGRLYVPGGATRAGFAAVATHEVLTP